MKDKSKKGAPDKIGDPARMRFGGDTMVIGEANERIAVLNGLRVESLLGQGVVYNVQIDRENSIAQIWVNMDDGGARCFRPYDLRPVNMDGQSAIMMAWRQLEQSQ